MKKSWELILVVDDDKNMRQLISLTLQEMGKVICVQNGEEALEKIADLDIDVIISDIDMPRLDGVKLLEILKQEQKMITPVIMITGVGIQGLTPVQSAVQCMKLGAFDYLDKQDITLEKLRNIVKRALESRKLLSKTQIPLIRDEEHDEPLKEVQKKREAEIGPVCGVGTNGEEITESALLNETIWLYDRGISFLHKISAMEAIDQSDWQKIQDFVSKVVEITKRGERFVIDVATNYSSNSSYLYDMIMNTCLLVIPIGIGMNYSKEQLIELGTAAFLHDIGMFHLEEDIVNQKNGLTKKQLEILQQHANYSIRKFKSLPEVSDNVKKGILQVHEKIDGSGYPEGLKGDDIHEYAQIISLANMYEAMTHTRPYKGKKLPHDAMRVIVNLAGRQYNPKITRMFVQQLSIYPIGSLVRLSNGKFAKVVESNKNFPLRPLVVTLDKNGKQLQESKIINLRKNPILNVKELVAPNEIGIDAKEILNISYKEYDKIDLDKVE